MSRPSSNRPPWGLRMMAALHIRGPYAQDILDDLEDLMVREVERGSPRWRAMLGYAANMFASAEEVWRDRLRATGWWGPFWFDFKLGARMVMKHPGLSLLAGLAMCLALTIVVAYAWIADNVLEPSLPFEEGDRIVALQSWDSSSGRQELRLLHAFLTWREELEAIEDIGAALLTRPNVIPGDGPAVPTFAAEITASAFRVTHVPALLGRPLQERDEAPGAAPVAVLAYDLWQRRFGGDPEIVGRQIRVDAADVEVVGVMPDGFRFPLREQLWLPFRLKGSEYARGEGPPIRVFGRLAPDVSIEQAEAELSRIGQRRATAFSETNAQLHPRIVRWAELVMPVGNSVFVTSTLLIVALILLVVSANVGILIFARSAQREQEIAMRAVLGARRSRIVVQLFVEVFLLAAVAAGFALLLGDYAVGRALHIMRIEWGYVPFWLSTELSGRTVPYLLGFATLAALVASVPPALKLTRGRFGTTIRQLGARGSELRFGRIATMVIVLQVAISVALLTRSANMLTDLPGVLGLDVAAVTLPFDEILTASLGMDRRPLTGSPGETPHESRTNRYRASREALAQRLRAEPSVKGVALANALPVGGRPEGHIEIEGATVSASVGRGYRVHISAVTPGFFDVMDAAVVAGRDFDSVDGEVPGVVVEETFAEHFLHGGDAVGRRIRFLDEARQASEWLTIVGVVQRIGLDSEDPATPPGVYYPLDPSAADLYLAVRTAEDPEEFVGRLRAVSTSIDPGLRLWDVASLKQLAERSTEVGKLAALVVASVALAALSLSLAGIYALVSFSVSRRTREIGIRTALGAGPERIVATVFSRALLQLGVGLTLGVMISIALAGGWQASLESGWLLAVSSLLGVMGLLACTVPTMQALHVNPTDAFKER